MEQNDDDDQGSSDQPTVIEDCAIYFSSDVVVEMLLTHIYSHNVNSKNAGVYAYHQSTPTCQDSKRPLPRHAKARRGF